MNIKALKSKKVKDSFINYSFTLNDHKVAVSITDSKTSYRVNSGVVKACDTVADALAQILKEVGAKFSFSKSIADELGKEEVKDDKDEEELLKLLTEYQKYPDKNSAEAKAINEKIKALRTKMVGDAAIEPLEVELLQDVPLNTDGVVLKKGTKTKAYVHPEESGKSYVTLERNDGAMIDGAIQRFTPEEFKKTFKVKDAVADSEDVEIDLEGKKVMAKKFKTMEDANNFISDNPTYKVSPYQDKDNSVYLIN